MKRPLPGDNSHVFVYRVPNDRGTIVVQGAHPRGKEWLNGSACPDCGKVGHVSYLGTDWSAWSREKVTRYRKGSTVVRVEWRRHGTHSGGDSVYECVWCGAAAAAHDLCEDWAKQHEEWNREKASYGYLSVRGDRRPSEAAWRKHLRVSARRGR